jgi:hypothetical protein
MIRRWWLGALVICLLTSGLLARQGILKTNDGRVIQGDIQTAPDGQSVNVTIKGATVTIPRDTVASITYPANAADAFQQRLSSLDKDDIKGRIDLCRWELRAHEYDLATEAAKDIQRINPHDPDAAILLDTIDSQKALDAKLTAQATSTTAPAPAPQTAPAAPPAASAPRGQYLTMDDVDVIRREELLPGDQERVQFLNNVRNRYLAFSGVDPAEFNNQSPTQQALDIAQSGHPQLMRDVKFDSDPSVMLQYRSRIQPRILAGCAAAGCHGSTGSGGFFLYPDADKTLVAYTNFYILQETSRKIEGGDVFGSGPVLRPMIDRLRHPSSLILQFGLPRSLATIPHPDVPNFKPMFRNEQDPTYIEMSDWISSLNVIVPNYGIHFEIPAGNPPATTQPTPDTAPTPG